MATTLVGTPINRVDARQKVTGTAQYAAEIVVANTTHAVLVGSSVAGGSIRTIDTSRAEQSPGVLLVLTHTNRGPLGEMPDDIQKGGTTAEIRPPLHDDKILHVGQYLAMVVAETSEQANFAASQIKVDYQPAPHAVVMEDAAASCYHPEHFMHEPLNFERGNFAKAFADSPIQLDETYSTANEHPCPLEPHATVASWLGDTLTVYNSTQWINGDQAVLRAAFQLEPHQIHVLCPFTGGMFGSKGATGAHTILAALASKRLGRPVKIVLSRPQVMVDVGHRSETVQRLQIGADRDGTLSAMNHKVSTHTSLADEFSEPASNSTRMLYQVPNYQTSHDLVRLNVMKPSWMRAPGEAPGQFALECAMDELAYKLQMDPVDLRRRNHTTVNPHNKKPFSSKYLLECYQQGADRFGWANRSPEPRSMRDGNTLIGWGMATAVFPGYRMGAVVRVRLQKDPDGIRALVSTAGSDVGTGMYTMLTVMAADQLGLPIERITVKLGDSELPPCAVAGGSNLTASTAPAVADACFELKQQLLKVAVETADGFTGIQPDPEQFVFRDGRVAHQSNPNRSIGYAELLTVSGQESMQADGSTTPIFGQNDELSFNSFGAHFVEVRMQEAIGRVRVSRITSVFDCGQIVSPKTARSQFIGAIVFGIGAALLEEMNYDRKHGQLASSDLASYLVPVHADVPEIDVSWIDKPDFRFNPLGVRGVGEIGITGMSAAIANAVYHACGIRVRDLPITPDKLIQTLQ